MHRKLFSKLISEFICNLSVCFCVKKSARRLCGPVADGAEEQICFSRTINWCIQMPIRGHCCNNGKFSGCSLNSCKWSRPNVSGDRKDGNCRALERPAYVQIGRKHAWMCLFWKLTAWLLFGGCGNCSKTATQKCIRTNVRTVKTWLYLCEMKNNLLKSVGASC